jgi:two-component system sensor histidine kinase HydH
MRYYDEVLTQSARNYAFTQNKKWEDRYRTIEPELDKILKEAIIMAEPTEREFVLLLDKANQALVKMEYKSFELVNNGKKDEAIKILESEEYEKQKKILSGGLYDHCKSENFEMEQPILLTPSFQIILDLEKRIAIKDASLRNEKMAAVGEVTSRITHDLKGPLSVIKNIVEILKIKNSGMDNQTKEYLAKIEQVVKKMSIQINDILEFVKPKNLDLRNSSIRDILRSSLERIIIPDTVKIGISGNDGFLICDTGKMEIVFSNIIENAIHAMNETGQINISSMDDKTHIVIEIQDFGPGIPSEFLPNLFEPLFTTKTNGTGLGLPSCKTIVERHGGTIDVKTDLGKGTTFIIKLPKEPRI